MFILEITIVRRVVAGSMPYKRSMSVSPAVDVPSQDTPRVVEEKRRKSMAILPRQLVVEGTDTTATSPAVIPGVFKKKKWQAIESQKLFAGKGTGSICQKKPVTAFNSVQGDGCIDEPEVITNPLRRKSMSTNDLTQLDASTTSDSISKIDFSTATAMTTTARADLKSNERDTCINADCQSPSGVVAPPVAIKTYKSSKTAVQAQLTCNSGAIVDESKPTVESTTVRLLAVASDRIHSDVIGKTNGLQDQFGVPSASRSAAEIDAPDSTVDANRNIESIAHIKHVESIKGEPCVVGETACRPKVTHQSPQVVHTKPLLPPKPRLLRHKSFNETVVAVCTARQSPTPSKPTTSNDLNNNCVKLQVRPEFIAPFAKPPRRQQVSNKVAAAAATVVTVQSVSGVDVPERKAKPKESEALSIDGVSIGANEFRQINDKTPAAAHKGIIGKEGFGMVGRGFPTMKEKPLPLKPKPKLVMRVVDFEITT